MNIDETRLWIKTTSARFPGLGDYFAKVEAGEAPKVVADWASAVESVQPEAASRFLGAMIAGDVEAPTWTSEWAKLPAMLRRWARDNRPMDASQPKSWSDPQAFRCLACRDTGGGVEVFNPVWVRAHEIAIENGLAGDWWREAKRWCSERGCGPLTFSVDCAECELGRKQIEKRKVQGRWVYRKSLFCKVPGGSTDSWSGALAEFVAEHPMIASAEWNPRQSYNDITGSEAY